MKHLALDVGNVWTGMAISDQMNLLARPLTTVRSELLFAELKKIFATEKIKKIIIGYPLTMKGTESAQTKQILTIKKQLENLFPEHTFVLCDERLSSIRANQGRKVVSKDEKIQAHSRAAAVILETYLTFLSSQSDSELKPD